MEATPVVEAVPLIGRNQETTRARRARIERVPWDAFLERFRWEQGEHVTLIGPTGQGKTTLALSILPRRRFVVVLACKPKDPLISSLKKEGYTVTRTWPAPSYAEKVVFWPAIERMSDAYAQREAFRKCLEQIYASGAWAVYADECAYLAEMLRLEPYLKMLWQQGRSLNVSFVASTQRPAFIPLAAYSQATHLFLWQDNDEANLKRLGGIAGANSKEVRNEVMRLKRHEALYVCTRTGEMLVTKARKR